MRGRRRPVRWILGGLAALAVVLVTGPKPGFVEQWRSPELPADLDAYLAASEADVDGVRAGDQKEIVWAGEPGVPTDVALVYLHGFSADRHEIEPVMSDLGREMAANVYFTRLAGHGRSGPDMMGATVERWLDDTAEAVAIGARIGRRVVLVGTSTGGTLATWAAARPEARDLVDAVVLISPNFQPADRRSRIILYPWGALVVRYAIGPERCFEPLNDDQARHWTTCYPTFALGPMMALVEHVRTMDLTGIEAPVLFLYSPMDSVVDAEESRRALAPVPRLRSHVVESTTDPAHHVLAGDIVSPGSSDDVRAVVRDFLTEVLELRPPNPSPD